MLTATCHRGAVRVDVPSRPRKPTNCNCSIRRRYGTLWAYYEASEVNSPGVSMSLTCSGLAKKDAALHAAAILKLLVTRLRQAWPGVRTIFRGDPGFCRPRLLSWCARHYVHYVVGMGKNSRLLADSACWRAQAARAFASTQQPQRIFGEFHYRAGTWPCHRRMIAKAEHHAQGANPRFVVTNQLPSVVAQSVPSAARGTCLCAAGATAHHRPGRHRTRPRSSLDPALPSAQGRRRHRAQHPPRPLLPRQCLPASSRLPPRGAALRLRITTAECRPRAR